MADVISLDRDCVLALLRAHEAAFRAAGVGGLLLFGSVARDAAGIDSDVDLLVEPSDATFTLLDLAGVQMQAADIIGTRVDVVTRGGLHPHRRQAVEADALRVF